MNLSKLLTFKNKPIIRYSGCSRDVNYYLYEGKKNFVRLISERLSHNKTWLMDDGKYI